MPFLLNNKITYFLIKKKENLEIKINFYEILINNYNKNTKFS